MATRGKGKGKFILAVNDPPFDERRGLGCHTGSYPALTSGLNE